MSNTIDTGAVKDTDQVSIRNLTDGSVIIVNPVSGKRYELPGHAILRLSAGEVRECGYDQGCRNIFHDYVRICNRELAREFGVTDDSYDNEYNWGDKEIVAAVTTADMDVLLDALDFAPEGIKQAILNKAVELEIPDIRKREAIGAALGVNVSNKIKNMKDAQPKEDEAKAPKTRRRTTTETTTTTKRRTTKAATKEK